MTNSHVVCHMRGGSLEIGLPIFTFDFPPNRMVLRDRLRKEAGRRIMRQDAAVDPRVVAQRVEDLRIASNCIVCCAGEHPRDFK